MLMFSCMRQIANIMGLLSSKTKSCGYRAEEALEKKDNSILSFWNEYLESNRNSLCLLAALSHPFFVGESEAGAVVGHSDGPTSPFSAVVCRNDRHVDEPALGGKESWPPGMHSQVSSSLFTVFDGQGAVSGHHLGVCSSDFFLSSSCLRWPWLLHRKLELLGGRKHVIPFVSLTSDDLIFFLLNLPTAGS